MLATKRLGPSQRILADKAAAKTMAMIHVAGASVEFSRSR
jgi:hypothetical protein